MSCGADMDLIADLIVTFVCLTLINVVGLGLIKCHLWSRVWDRTEAQAVALATLLFCHLLKLHLGI